MVFCLIARSESISAMDFIGTCLRTVIVCDGLSLVIDGTGVIRYLKGER